MSQNLNLGGRKVQSGEENSTAPRSAFAILGSYMYKNYVRVCLLE
jgi:dTDP-glucose pyrophosphorylase